MINKKQPLKNEIISLLRKLISINSANPFRTIKHKGLEIGIGNESEITSFLEERLKEAGFNVQKQLVQEKIVIQKSNEKIHIPERYNLIAEKGTGKESILFLGHMDTVDVKDGWETSPFQGIIRNIGGKERIYGLGSCDMKAGIVITLLALKDVYPKDYKIKVAFVADEEFWSFGAVKLLESNFLNDVKIALITEIGDFDKKTNNQSIVLGRMGRTEYLFEIEGVACHGAQARVNKYAVNAVHESIKLQKEIIKYCKKNSKTFTNENLSITNSSYISFHEGGKPILSVPEKASFILDRSFVIGEDIEKEILILKKIINKSYKKGIIDKRAKITVKERPRPTPPCKPYFFSPSLSQVKYVTEKVDSIIGNHEYGIGYSVADENRLAEKGILSIVIGPKGERCHSPQEWVDIESVINLTKVYKSIAEDFGKLVLN